MYLGIDIGSPSLKAAAFDARRGRLLAQTAQRLVLVLDETGKREQDPAALIQALCAAAGSLRHQVADRWNKVKGIGLAAQGGSTILVNRHADVPVERHARLRPLPQDRRQAAAALVARVLVAR